jgi:hypothetical protein
LQQTACCGRKVGVEEVAKKESKGKVKEKVFQKNQYCFSIFSRQPIFRQVFYGDFL